MTVMHRRVTIRLPHQVSRPINEAGSRLQPSLPSALQDLSPTIPVQLCDLDGIIGISAWTCRARARSDYHRNGHVNITVPFSGLSSL